MEKQGKVIGNVGVLDLRTATEASLAEIRHIHNVGMIFYSAQTVHLIPLLNASNLGTVKEVPHDAKFINGQHTFNRESFNQQGTHSLLVINGQVIFTPDVSVDNVKEGLGQLMVNGQVIYPDHLAGVLQSKMFEVNGQQLSYDGQAKLITGGLTLDETVLQALADDTKLAITGKLTIPQVVANDVLARKIKQLQVFGKVVLREENAATIQSRLDNRGEMPRTTIIPAGFAWVDRPLQIDAETVEILPGRQLYCTEAVQIGVDVSAAALDAALDKLIVKEQLICPASLKQVLAQKCNLFETKVIFYQGELWLVDNETTLLAARFNYLEGKATLVVYGELLVATDVDPAVLAGRLDKVHNFGEIKGTRDQLAALQARLGTDKGEFSDVQGTDDTDQEGMGNIGYLKL